MRPDDRVTGDTSRYATQATIIHIDIDASELNKIIPTDVPVHADAREALLFLTHLVKERSHESWVNEFKEAKQTEVETLSKGYANCDTQDVRMDEVIKLLSNLTHGESIIVTDVGQHQMMAARYYQYNKTKSNVTSGGLGTMGFALPAAIGAKLGMPDKDVIAIIGDGGFQMTLQELGTILQSKIPVKIVILNNNFLGMVRQWQEMFFERRYSFTEMISPDYVKLAESYGIQAKSIASKTDLEDGLREMLDAKEAYLLEVKVVKEENVFPMVPTGASVSEIRLA